MFEVYKITNVCIAISKGVTQQVNFASGNLLGPVVITTTEGGLERFFSQPSGCGEQTMIGLAPNVYVLEYLMNTNQLSGANEKSAYRFIQSGLLIKALNKRFILQREHL